MKAEMRNDQRRQLLEQPGSSTLDRVGSTCIGLLCLLLLLLLPVKSMLLIIAA